MSTVLPPEQDCKKLKGRGNLPKPVYSTENNPDFTVLEGQVTFDAEKHESNDRYNSRTAHYPGGVSGVTIGPGYDLKDRYDPSKPGNSLLETSITKTLTKIGLTSAEAEEYRAGAGKSAIDACNFINDNRDKLRVITPKEQKELFELTYPFHQAEVLRIATQPTNLQNLGVLDWHSLTPGVQELLTDLKYRGDYKEATFHRYMPYVTNVTPENQASKLQALKDSMNNPEWETEVSVPTDRFNRRRAHTVALTSLLKTDTNFKYTETTVWNLENSRTSPSGYDRFKVGDGLYGIGIGKGLNLALRKCFRGRTGHEQEMDADEVEKYLRHVGITDPTRLKIFKKAIGITGKLAIDNYLKGKTDEVLHSDAMTITLEIEKKLFLLFFSQYEADLKYICGGLVYTGAYGAYNWYRLDRKIKAILIDMAFTDHLFALDSTYHKIVREKILPHVASNSRAKFTNALKGWKKWPQFTSSSAQTLWKDRFENRIAELEKDDYSFDPNETECKVETPLPLIFPTEKKLRQNSEIPFPLPILEPATVASPEFDFENPGNKIVTDLLKTDELIPEMLKLTRTYRKGQKNPEIADISFPATQIPLFIENAFAEGENRQTNLLKVSGIELSKIKQGMRVRLERKVAPFYQYVFIKSIQNGTLELLEMVNLTELSSSDCHVDATFFLPLNKINLAGLLGEKLPSIDIMISGPGGQLKHAVRIADVYHLPVNLDIFFPNLPTSTQKVEYQHLSLLMDLALKQTGVNWRLESTVLYLSFPEAEEEVYEFEVFSLLLPKRSAPSKRADETQYDLSIDLDKREVIFFEGGSIKPELYFPGGLRKEIEEANGDIQAIEKAKKKRFLCQFNPEPIGGGRAGNYLLKLNKGGISFNASVVKREVHLVDEGTIQMTPKDKGPQIEGKIHIRNNNIEAASISSTLVVPGFKDLIAEISISIRKEQPESPPVIVAEIGLENQHSLPLADLSLAFLRMQLTKLRLHLGWDMGTSKWDVGAFANGTISFTEGSPISPDLLGLVSPSAIVIENLNLLKLHQRDVNLGFQLSEDINFDILDGLFGVTMNDLRFEFQGTNGFSLFAKETQVRFNQSGAFEVIVGTKSGNPNDDAIKLSLEGTKFNIDILKPLSITVRLGPNIMFKGSAGWIKDPSERFFFAQGDVIIEGFPSFKGLLKFGTVTKENGEKAPNIVLYGAQDGFNIQLFAGVIVKSIGCGIGINNRLVGIDSTPTEQEILDNIDQIVPEEYTGWSRVVEDGFYLSIVGSTILSADMGSTRKVSAYVAELIMSLDTDLNVVAAGRLWLSSSVDGALRNRQNPLLVGALALSTKQKRFGARLETRPNPFVEKNKWLKDVVQLFKIRISFRLTESLVDYHLEEFSFQTDFWGVNMQYIASYRFAIFRSAVLIRSTQSITGSYGNRFRAGPGGIDFHGNVALKFGYAGLLTEKGIIAYGMISSEIHFSMTAFVEVGFRETIRVWKWKKTISWTVRFDASLSANILFSGQAAIIENGSFGFMGTAAVSISICGHGLSIGVGFNINPERVSQAIQRVASFESKLDEIGQGIKKLGTDLPRLSLSFLNTPFKKLQANATDEELWFHLVNEVTNYHLFIPAEKTPWYIPRHDENRNLTDAVERIVVGDVLDQHFLWHNIEIYDPAHPNYPNNSKIENALSFVLGGSQRGAIPPTVEQTPIVYSHPLVESDNREYLSLEDQERPEHYRTYEFRDLSDLLRDSASTASREELEKIKDYQDALTRVSINRQHSIDNEDPFEASRQNRARATKGLIDDLNHPSGPQLFGEYRINSSSSGVIFHSDRVDDMKARIKAGQVWIWRNGVREKIRCQTISEEVRTTPFKNLIIPLPIRQKYIEKEEKASSPDKEFAKTFVKLPIKIDALIQQDKLAELSHFKIYRKLPGEDHEELIEEFARPGLAFIETPEMGVPLVLTDGKFQMKSKNHTVVEKLGKIDRKNAYLQIESDTDTQWLPLDRLEFDSKAGFQFGALNLKFDSAMTYTLLLNAAKAILVDPYLFTDIYYHKDGKVYVKRNVDGKEEFQETKIIPDVSEAAYTLRVVPQDGRQNIPEDQALLKFPQPLILHVPKKSQYSNELTAIFPAGSLLLAPQKNPTFQLVDMETRRPQRIDADSIELWVKQVPLQRSGFYAGEKGTFGNTNIRKAVVEGVEQEELRESVVGKIRVALTVDNDVYEMTDGLAHLPSGFGYQFFIREATSNEKLLLKPLRHALVKEIPSSWHKNIKIRNTEQIEWIPNSEKVRSSPAGYTFLPEHSFSVQGVYDSALHENYLDINFTTHELNDGGVEILIQDRDEPLTFATQSCEILEENLFSQSLKTFSLSSTWEVSPKQIRPSIMHRSNIRTSLSEDAIANFYFNFDTSTSDVIDHLKIASTELNRVLNLPLYSWREELYPALLGYLGAVANFEKSPLNIGEVAVKAHIEKGRNLAANLLISSKFENPIDQTHSFIAERDEAHSAAADNLEEKEYIDIQAARELLGIVRRRVQVASEMLRLSNIINLPQETHFSTLPNQHLPGFQRWEDIRKDLSGTSKPNADAIFDIFPDNTKTTKDSLIQHISDLERVIKEHTISLAKVVPHASIIAELLDALEADKLYVLDKRPHHTLTTDFEGPIGATKLKPKSISFNAFFSSESKPPEGGSRDIPVDYSKNVSNYFNLLEYLGFAIDLSLKSSTGATLSQHQIAEVIESKISTLPSGTTAFILLPTSPVIISNSEQTVGYSFVKVAFLPQPLLQDITKWLSFRGIDKDLDLPKFEKIQDYIDSFIEGSTVFNYIYLQQWDKRWLTLPAIAGQTETSHPVPDRFGHRYRVAIRTVSRYEPLVHWYEGTKKPSEISAETLEHIVPTKSAEVIPVLPTPDGAYGEMVPVFNIPHPKTAQFIYQLPSHAGRAMKNQIAAIRNGYQGSDLVFQHSFIDRKGEKSVVSILNEFNFKTDVTAVPDRASYDISYDDQETLQLYDHERLVSIPELPHYYRYFLSTRTLYHTNLPATGAFHVAKTIVSTSGKEIALQKPQAFPAVPWIVEIESVATGAILTRRVIGKREEPGSSKLILELESPLEIHAQNSYLRLYKEPTSTTVEPQHLTIFKPKIQKVGETEGDPEGAGNGPTIDFAFRVYLSRNIDHYLKQIDAPRGAEPPPMEVEQSIPAKNKIFTYEFPELSTDYLLYWEVSATDKDDPYYLPVLAIRMPWSEEANNSAFPVIKQIATGISLLDASGQRIDPFPASGQPITIQAFPSSEGSFSRYLYALDFTLRIESSNVEEKLYDDPSKYVIEAHRNKAQTQAIRLKE